MIDFKSLVMLFRFALTDDWKRSGLLLAALLLHLLLCLPSAAQSEEEKIVAGIRASHKAAYALTAEQQEALATRLRQITGWKELQFTDNGELVTGNIFVTEGGSALA